MQKVTSQQLIWSNKCFENVSFPGELTCHVATQQCKADPIKGWGMEGVDDRKLLTT